MILWNYDKRGSCLCCLGWTDVKFVEKPFKSVLFIRSGLMGVRISDSVRTWSRTLCMFVLGLIILRDDPDWLMDGWCHSVLRKSISWLINVCFLVLTRLLNVWSETWWQIKALWIPVCFILNNLFMIVLSVCDLSDMKVSKLFMWKQNVKVVLKSWTQFPF